MFPLYFIRRATSHRFSLPAFIALLVVATGCGSNSVIDPGTTDTPPQELFAEWDYVGGTIWRGDSTLQSLSHVGGTLVLNSDKTWSHTRSIGTITDTGDGDFTVKGDTITLIYRDGSGDIAYEFYVDSEPDPAGGTRGILRLDSMRDPDGSWFSFVLRERKE